MKKNFKLFLLRNKSAIFYETIAKSFPLLYMS